jgi:putative transposase
MSTDDDYPPAGTDGPWAWLQPVRRERTWRSGGPGRPPGDVRRRLHGLLSLHQPGGHGRLGPQDWGHWSPREGSCKRWRRDGVWARVRATLRQGERRDLGRQPAPAAGSLDSQSLKTATPREDLGVDGHQTLTGRQRHLLVDTLGVIMGVGVTSADTEDRLGVVAGLRQDVAEGVRRLRHRGVEGASPAAWLEAGGRGVKPTPTLA